MQRRKTSTIEELLSGEVMGAEVLHGAQLLVLSFLVATGKGNCMLPTH
jgi:hypothetical protein